MDIIHWRNRKLEDVWRTNMLLYRKPNIPVTSQNQGRCLYVFGKVFRIHSLDEKIHEMTGYFYRQLFFMVAVLLLLIYQYHVSPGMTGLYFTKSLPKTIHLFAIILWFPSSITQQLGAGSQVFLWRSWAYQNWVILQVLALFLPVDE